MKPGFGSSTGENPWGDGPQQFSIKSISVKMGERIKPGEDFRTGAREPWPQATFVYVDDEGDSLREPFVNLTNGMRMNEKSNFYDRIACALGMKVKDLCAEKDGTKLELDFGPEIKSWEDLLADLNNGFEIALDVSYDGELIFGKPLTLNLETSDKGWPRVKSASVAATGKKAKRLETTEVAVSAPNQSGSAAPF